MPAIEAAASPLGVELSRYAVRDAADIERAMRELAAQANVGLIEPFLTSDGFEFQQA